MARYDFTSLSAQQMEAELVVAEGKAKKPRLPTALPEQVAMVRDMLSGLQASITAENLARQFSQGRRVKDRVEDVLKTLAMLGQAERVDGGFILSSR